MVIKVLDIVSQCYTNEDGQKVYDKIWPVLMRGENVVLSFEGVDTTPSSFINSALIQLLGVMDFDQIKQRLKIIKTTKQINNMIRQRFEFEINRVKTQK
ncbi:STAS-like domain-containing protein [Methylocaldum sp.]|uniref:STAS-like domain-containing protein n=1 Tax=Methylocaldum sp. TaxID=1969727 RepID=UPI0039C9BE41